MYAFLIPALLLGMASSTHCIAMCGPLAMAIPVSKVSWYFYLGRVFYNLGRIFTYFLLGGIFGAFGLGLTLLGWQQYLSLIAGGLIISYFIIPKKWKTKTESFFSDKVFIQLKKAFGPFLKMGGLLAHLMIGILNGFLPCGMVYAALALSVAQDSVLTSAQFMAAFGAGTLPLMLAVSLFPQMTFFQSLKRGMKKYATQLALIIALVFIVRGLGLGIPYISPAVDESGVVVCD